MLTIVGDIHGMAAKLENLLGQIDRPSSKSAAANWRRVTPEGRQGRYLPAAKLVRRG